MIGVTVACRSSFKFQIFFYMLLVLLMNYRYFSFMQLFQIKEIITLYHQRFSVECVNAGGYFSFYCCSFCFHCTRDVLDI
jgi:hypothetical protein